MIQPFAPLGVLPSQPAAIGERNKWRDGEFRSLFEQLGPQMKPAVNGRSEAAHKRVVFTPAGAEVRLSRTGKALREHNRSGAAVAASERNLLSKLPAAEKSPGPNPTAGTPPNGPLVSGTNPDWFTPIAEPQSLEPLFEALRRAGIDPDLLQFSQIEALEKFPGKPHSDYTTRQVLIKGQNASAMFDLALALRSPWITVAELQAYGVV